MERLFLYSIQVGETAPSAGLTLRWTVPFQLHLHSLTLCNTGGGEGINARHQFLPTRMWGLRRGSKFGSEPAEARPSLAMMIINVKNPRTPTRRSMKTRCFQEKDVRFPPVRFLNKQKRKSVKRANTMTFVKTYESWQNNKRGPSSTGDHNTYLRIWANQLSAGRLRYLSSSKSICVTELWPMSRVS